MTQQESLDALRLVRAFLAVELQDRYDGRDGIPQSLEESYCAEAEAALNAIDSIIEDHPLIVAERRAEAEREDREAMETGADRCPPRE